MEIDDFNTVGEINIDEDVPSEEDFQSAEQDFVKSVEQSPEIDEKTKKKALKAIQKATSSAPSKKEKKPQASEVAHKGSFAIAALKKVKNNIDGTIMSGIESTWFISSGHLGTNYCISGKWLGGGYGMSKMIEIYGPSQSAKSAEGYIALAEICREGGIGVVLDSEGGMNEDFMKTLGINPEQIVELEPKDKDGNSCPTIENVFVGMAKFEKTMRKEAGFEGPICYLLDSIATCPSQDEWDNLKAGKNIKEDQGRRAKLVSSYARPFNKLVLRDHNSIVIIINQLREKPGVMFGPKETTTSGKTVGYYADTRIKIESKKQITRTLLTKGTAGSTEGDGEKFVMERKIGVLLKVTADKTRCTAPFKFVGNVEFFFEKGINPISGLFDLLLLQEYIMKVGNSNYYCFTDPDNRGTGKAPIPMPGSDYKFMRKAVETLEWVLENHKFFGAKSEAEMLEFLKPNLPAYEYSCNVKGAAINGDVAVNFSDNDEEDDDRGIESSAAVRNLVKESGGKIEKPKASTIPQSELIE